MQPHPLRNFLGKICEDLVKIWQIWAKFAQNLGNSDYDLGKFDYIWAKSKSCMPKNIRSPKAMLDLFFV